jgi:hypothetical protein
VTPEASRARHREGRHRFYQGEMYFGTGDALPTELALRAAQARRARLRANPSASCVTCPAVAAGV